VAGQVERTTLHEPTALGERKGHRAGDRAGQTQVGPGRGRAGCDRLRQSVGSFSLAWHQPDEGSGPSQVCGRGQTAGERAQGGQLQTSCGVGEGLHSKHKFNPRTDRN
jgi:hypothetical protein